VNRVYRALSDPTRRRILELLRERDRTAGELAEHFPQAKPTLSRHFAVLREADLIEGTRSGSSITYHLNVSVLEDALLALLGAFRIGHRGGRRR
jgi:DNA-binding transcriptional ArsR family regulator